jgi:protein SCO1/2
MLQFICIASLFAWLPAVSQADEDVEKEFRSKKPEVAENIGIDSKTGDFIPMDLMFRDTDGTLVELGTLFDGTQPVMLSFNYSNCPKLCSVQLDNMTLTLREVAKTFKVDQDFQVVSISIDPNEQTVRSRATEDKYIKMYNQPGTEEGWHFLTGKRDAIAKITDVCGFRYRYIARQKYYSHPPVFILVSPEGKIVRYIHGLKYDKDTMTKAFIEAAEGKIGSPINWLSYGLGCFVFDESKGQYTFQAMAIMRIGGLIMVAVLLVTLVPYWFFGRRSTQHTPDDLDTPKSLNSKSLPEATA